MAEPDQNLSNHDLTLLAQALAQQRQDIDRNAASLGELDGAVADVARALRELLDQQGQAADRNSDQHTNGWTAYHGDMEILTRRIEALRQWVAWANETVFLAHSNHKGLPGCWENHPGVAEELLALHAAWIAAYTQTGPSDAMIAWHDRWLTPCLTRLLERYALDSCRKKTCRLAARESSSA